MTSSAPPAPPAPHALPQAAAASGVPVPAPGRYRHYKGPLYEVIGVARHSETEKPLVVYRALYGEFGLWVRPLAMFVGEVEVDGQRVRRFAPMQENEA